MTTTYVILSILLGAIIGMYAAGLLLRFMLTRRGYKLASPDEASAAVKYNSLECPMCADGGSLVITESHQRCANCEWIGAAVK